MTQSTTDDITPETAAAAWDRDAAARALDELFHFARRYQTSEKYRELLRFAARFRWYSPFNAMLAHIQKPGATYVAPAYRWLREYDRRIKPGGQPIVLLQPIGPVMFVFDVGDTEAMPGARPLPRAVTAPFEVTAGFVGGELPLSIANARRDGVRIAESDMAPQSAGWIRPAQSGPTLSFQFRWRPRAEFRTLPLHYELVLNASQSFEARYVTLMHELAHLYCGHLGTPDPGWWPDRTGLSESVREFEAESVAFLVCGRLGIDNRSEEYLAGYVREHSETPPISLDCVLKAAGLIEQMERSRMPPRLERKTD